MNHSENWFGSLSVDVFLVVHLIIWGPFKLFLGFQMEINKLILKFVKLLLLEIFEFPSSNYFTAKVIKDSWDSEMI